MTLTEILVALGIISIGLVGLASVMPISSYGIQQGNQVSTATFLAEQRLEQLKAAQWTWNPTTGAVDCLGVSGANASNWSFSGGTPPGNFTAGCPNFDDETPSSNALPTPYTTYTRQARIQPCDAAGSGCGVSDATIRLVTVRASYTPLQGIGGVATTQEFVELSMLIARR
jgi:type II secretory pathway pseudopilin PulG